MGVISRLYNFVVGTTIDSEQVDAEFNQILAVLNGSIDPANLSTASKNTFLKLATAADKKEALGFYSAGSVGSWGAGTTVTGAIPHGLGATPGTVHLQPTAGDTGAQDITAVVVSADATNINYRLISHGGALSFPGVGIYWRATA